MKFSRRFLCFSGPWESIGIHGNFKLFTCDFRQVFYWNMLFCWFVIISIDTYVWDVVIDFSTTSTPSSLTRRNHQHNVMGSWLKLHVQHCRTITEIQIRTYISRPCGLLTDDPQCPLTGVSWFQVDEQGNGVKCDKCWGTQAVAVWSLAPRGAED